MLSFVNDYCEGCHEEILKKLTLTNLEKLPGYGEDKYCASAKEKIRKACGCPDADIFFINGGTQTNQLAIDCFLSPWEGVIAAATGHVSLHEAGAIEFTGHKVIELGESDGKLAAYTVDTFCKSFFADENHDHMTFPGMVYISHPTEYGTLYTLGELKELRQVCDKHGLKLYVDGARLGYALACPGSDVTLQNLASLTDAFYIGGTKVGALTGEALVYPHGAPSHMVTRVKQHGALSAKGRLMGISFDTLFTDDLYIKAAKNALERAEELKNAFREKGYRFFIDSPTNQIFIIMDDRTLDELRGKAEFAFWEKYDEKNTVIRCATSWATTKEDAASLAELLPNAS